MTATRNREGREWDKLTDWLKAEWELIQAREMISGGVEEVLCSTCAMLVLIHIE